LLLSSLPDIFQIILNERRDLRGLPIGLLWFLGPGKREMPNLSRFLGLFENRKDFDEHLPLPFPVPDLTYWPSIGIFNGGCSRYAHSPSKFMGRRKNNSGKTSLF
jgi:hypothetical protein